MTNADEMLELARAKASHLAAPSLDARPRRRLAILMCMDARLDVLPLGVERGDAHVIRNAGGLVTDDVLRSLVLSQRLLQTREIVLMLHSDCGLFRMDEEKLRAQIASETGREPPSFGAFHDVDEAVKRGLTRIREHPFLPHRDRVRGFVYEVETGRLREVRS